MAMTMNVGDFTESSLLIPNLPGVDQAGAIHSLSHRLREAGCIEDWLGFFQAALQQDYLSSAAIEGGIAFPHARVRGVNRLSLAVGLSKAGIHWRDGSPVHAIFLMAVPPNETQFYLSVVSALARSSRMAEWVTALVACNHPGEMLRALNEVDVNWPGNVKVAPGAAGANRTTAAGPPGESSYAARPKDKISGPVA
ncbi:MAG TPA: PTS sugar transporter subunit IIA [Verrucomicrobiae bacterium]|nr:PTS sugar transporter subunit IIA [Verrucomicrobiae bacterium]